MAAKIILNPYAGRWNARKRLPEVKEALAVAGIVYELIETTKPGHGIQLAEEAVRDGFNPIISAGGDGSMSEVINGVINSHLENNSRSKCQC